MKIVDWIFDKNLENKYRVVIYTSNLEVGRNVTLLHTKDHVVKGRKILTKDLE